jgi:hypothetical protein
MPFVPGTSPEPAVIPTAQASSFTMQYFRIMCDVPSTAVFCGESIECFPGMASKFVPKTFAIIVGGGGGGGGDCGGCGGSKMLLRDCAVNTICTTCPTHCFIEVCLACCSIS